MILDRSIYSDLVFTNVVFQDGNISKDGMKIMTSYFYFAERVNQNARRLKISCSLNIKAMILKTVLFDH